MTDTTTLLFPRHVPYRILYLIIVYAVIQFTTAITLLVLHAKGLFS
jgi:hypothetical protein